MVISHARLSAKKLTFLQLQSLFKDEIHTIRVKLHRTAEAA